MRDSHAPVLPDWAKGILTEADLDIPVAVSRRDGRILTVAGVIAAPEDVLTVDDLPPPRREQLVVEAIAAIPTFRIGISGSGPIDRTAALDAIAKGTPAGRAAVTVMVNYLRDLALRAVNRALPPPASHASSDDNQGEPPTVTTTGAGVLVIDGGDDGAPFDVVQLRMSFYERLGRPDAALVMCTGIRATRTAALALATPEVGLIVGFGHGAPDEFYGRSGGDPIFRAGDPDASVVSGKIVHLIGCEAATDLGPALVADHGALAFFGYADRFTYPASGEEAAEAFACISEINAAIRAGSLASEVHETALAAFDARVNRYQAKDPFTAAIFAGMRDAFRSPGVDERYGQAAACLLTGG